jgi:hypothetical protein
VSLEDAKSKEQQMTKEVQKITCNFCESSYKVLYDYEETQGQPRFCSFCGEECFDEDEVEFEGEDE